MISRRTFLVTVAGSAAIAPHATEAQPPRKMARVGILAMGSGPRDPRLLTVFYDRLRTLGWIEGQNIAFEIRYSGDKPERLSDLAAELVRLNVDVISVYGTPPAKAAKQVTATTPIVTASVADAIGSGLVASLARPGGNVTGMANNAREEMGKQLEVLKETAPSISRVSVLGDPIINASVGTSGRTIRDAAAKALGITLQRIEVGSVADLDSAMTSLPKQMAEAVIVYPLNNIPLTHIQRFADFAAKNRLPTLTVFPS